MIVDPLGPPGRHGSSGRVAAWEHEKRGLGERVEPLLCFPDPLPSEVALALDRAGYRLEGRSTGPTS